MPPSEFQGSDGRIYSRVGIISDHGFTCIVHEYKDTRTGGRVAVKIPRTAGRPDSLVPSFETMERHAYEVIRTVNPECSFQDHVVPAIDMVELANSSDCKLAVVWGWGGDRMLSEECEANAPLSVQCARQYTRHVLYGLRALHTAGYTHGDLHERNVVVDGADTANLIDFGTCTSIGTSVVQRYGLEDKLNGPNPFGVRITAEALKATSKTPKSHQQWPPELVVQRIALSHCGVVAWYEHTMKPSFDVWAAGACMFYMLAGESPWSIQKRMYAKIDEDAGGTAGARSILRSECERVLLKTASRHEVELVVRMLEPDPSLRATVDSMLGNGTWTQICHM